MIRNDRCCEKGIYLNKKTNYLKLYAEGIYQQVTQAFEVLEILKLTP